MRRMPHLQCKQQAERLAMLHHNLLRLNSTLPLHVFTSGSSFAAPGKPQEDNRALGDVGRILSHLEQQGVGIHSVPMPVAVPRWASPEKRSTFAKLSVLNASLALRRRLIFLDTDLLLLRNLDHLASTTAVPAPLAFVTRANSELINTGLFVVDVRSRRQLESYWAILQRAFVRMPWVPCAGDGSDQQAVIHMLPRAGSFYELPNSYNCYAWLVNESFVTASQAPLSTRFAEDQGGKTHGAARPGTASSRRTSVPWCMRVYVVHKTGRIHRMGISQQCLQYIRRREEELRRAVYKL
jgi:hypothetical protein